MLRQGKPNWIASVNAPNPKEATYWIDINSNPDGQIVKCYTNGKWVKLNEESNEIYNTLNEIKDVLSKKANSADVYTKAEVDKAIKAAITKALANKIIYTTE